MQELSFINPKHPHDLFRISVKNHDTISKGIHVTDQNQSDNIQGEITQKLEARVKRHNSVDSECNISQPSIIRKVSPHILIVYQNVGL